MKIATASNTRYYRLDQLKNAKYQSNGELLADGLPAIPKPGHTEGHITVAFKIGLGEPKIFSKKTMGKAASFIAQLLVKHDLTPTDILAHREVAVTKCPSDPIYTWLRGSSMTRTGEGVGMKLIKKEYEKLTNS